MKYEKLKPNSQKYKDEMEKRDKQEQIITTPVVKPKKTGLRKVLGFFLTESPAEAARQVLTEEIRPGIGRLIFNALSSGLEHMFGFEEGYDYSLKDRSSYRAYDKASDRDNRKRVTRKSLEEFREWKFSKDDAENILIALEDSIDEYGDAPVAMIYEAIGEAPDPEHYNYGWSDLKNSDIVHTRGGWSIQLPRIERID